MVTTLALAVLVFAVPQDPVLHEDRVVLRTSAGEIVVALFPQVAPQHVAHFLRLVRSGYYDGTRFSRVYPGFLIQSAGEVDRLRPLDPEQEELNKVKLPAEFSRLLHARGMLSMSRDPGDPDSGRSAFNIMLGEAPQLDGKYTIFGRVEKGLEVADALSRAPTGADNFPKHPVNLHRAWVLGEEPGTPLDNRPPVVLFVVGGSAIVAGLAGFLLAGRVLPKSAGPIGLSVVFTGFFIGFIAAVPLATQSETKVIPLLVFVSLLALFKLMNRFESLK